MTAKEVVAYLKQVHNVEYFNYAQQIRLANKLLEKYSGSEIRYAISYYKDKGEHIYSLGYLLYSANMKHPVSLYHAELNITDGGENSADRNKQRIANSEAECGEDAFSYLFTEPGQDN